MLHTADLHLDWPFPSFPAELRALRRREIAAIFSGLVDLAIERRLQAVAIAGDLFQAYPPPVEASLALVAGCRRLAERSIPVLITPGPDEARLGLLARLGLPDNVHLLGGPAPSVCAPIPGLTVYAPPTSPERDFRPLQGFRCQNQPGLHLAVAHGTYEGLPPGGADGHWWPIAVEDIARSGLDYLALGHHHEYFTCVHGGTQAAYPGSPAHLGFGQGTNRVALIVGLTEGPPSIEPVAVKDRAHREFGFDLSKEDFAEVLQTLAREADPAACAHVILHGSLHGEVEFFADRLAERLAGVFFWLQAEDRTEIAVPAEGRTIQDRFVERLRAAIARTDLPPEERAVQEYALRAGLVALRGGQL